MKKWQWTEVDASYYVEKTFEDVTKDFRGPNPVGLLTYSTEGPEVVVINLFPPINQVFWASNGYAALEDLPRLVHDFLPEEQAPMTAALKKMLRMVKIKFTSPQVRWFGQYAQIAGLFKRSVPSLSTSYLSYLENWRWTDVCVKKERLKNLQLLLETEIEQFGDFAFWTCDERVRLGADSGNFESSLDARVVGDGAWERLLPGEFPDAAQKVHQETLSAIASTIRRMEVGTPFDYRIETRKLLASPRFYRMSKLNWGHSTEFRVLEDQILSHRARLVRLLGWPSHYATVARTAREDGAVEKWGDIVEPYNLLDELQQYLADMESKYPVLTGKY